MDKVNMLNMFIYKLYIQTWQHIEIALYKLLDNFTTKRNESSFLRVDFIKKKYAHKKIKLSSKKKSFTYINLQTCASACCGLLYISAPFYGERKGIVFGKKKCLTVYFLHVSEVLEHDFIDFWEGQC